ncbi:sugar ABC transporter ATP-binding protein [Anoxynatronum buryatiense]|uniref:Monosaccharide ABC transporter ATP-binding protein, CUT2 family n=1 Tax=Anoxynatronum buryatiense TaxID=489973 RepID=A0AA45WYJ2_9CLOT|nr:sugar ABC transporter ATP-binding protein [Anoxynatronum buryatiense]SMP69231.1 monosaccharide ABC transporter ATP-binding protein, CUT2 family [Anoxynatronum buryatiense]
MRGKVKLKVSGIEKSFPGVKALDSVHFEVKEGTVHALCGENGAGKSTLMKIINGIHRQDAGDIHIDGEKVAINHPQHAQQLGIAMIAQELNFVPELTVEENLFLGRLPGSSARVDWKQVRKSTIELLERENLPFKPTQLMKTLSISEIQQLEILKALSIDAQIIIMDEPTSSISNKEVETLFQKIEQLRNQGRSIIYISHKLDEIFRIADEVTILRDGTVVGSYPIEEMDEENIIRLMVGRKLDNVYPKEAVAVGQTIFEVKDFTSEGEFKGITFNVKRGEIVGFAGLVGSGRTEVMRALFGLDPHTSGSVYLKEQEININHPRDAIAAGIGMITEDRKRSGIVPVRSIKENGSLASLEKFFTGGRLQWKKEEETNRDYFEKMDVKAPSLETLIQTLSGGNQQKVILAKWMMREPDLLIMDEPTRGIDVGNKFAIYQLMQQIAREGKAILIVSSELPELLGMCDRIYVMNQGTITGELKREAFDQEVIMKYATM